MLKRLSIALLALAVLAAGQTEEKEPFKANEGFPAPTPAAPPSVKDTKEGTEIQVGGPSGWTVKPYEDIDDAVVGDTLVFKWVGSQTVWKLKEKVCEFTEENGQELATTEDSRGANPGEESEFKFTFTDPGTVFFASSFPGNCVNGMIFKVEVSGSP